MPPVIPQEEAAVIDALAVEIMEALARQFPVCLASDEFHFFPQAASQHHEWSRWDDFSPDALGGMNRQLSAWEDDLANVSCTPMDPDALIDISMLIRVMRTLREQFRYARMHETQPTFYLTVAAIGMAEALETGPHAWQSRLKTLPDFIHQARRNLTRIPAHFRELGLEMTENTRLWLVSLDGQPRHIQPVVDALDDFGTHLRKIPTDAGFTLPKDQLQRIVRHHIGCGMGIDDTYAELERERREMTEILEREARRMMPGRSWQAVLADMPVPEIPEGGQATLYRSAINALGRHCADRGLIEASLLTICPVRVTPVPAYLSTIRSTAAYSMPPGHPPRGGTFYVDDRFNPDHLPHDYCLLTAHETFAGHHLLDTARWGLKRRLRRHIEFPLFYEGWACFSEKLLFHTGFFEGAADRFLLAKRRFWRAMRGMVDLDLQTGRKNMAEAAEFLMTSGMNRRQALAMTRRYALKPGYQLCYTIGMRWFEKIYGDWRKKNDNPSDFARKVFTTGEIGLANLEKMLCNDMDDPSKMNSENTPPL